MQAIPYLNFLDQCEAAFKRYEAIFGGTLTIHRFGDMPPSEGGDHGPKMPPNAVMHANLVQGEFVVMGSDCPPPMFKPMQGMSVSVNAKSFAEGERVFKALSEGGQTTMLFAETFWAAGFGMCVDRFGTPWMVNVDH